MTVRIHGFVENLGRYPRDTGDKEIIPVIISKKPVIK